VFFFSRIDGIHFELTGKDDYVNAPAGAMAMLSPCLARISRVTTRETG